MKGESLYHPHPVRDAMSVAMMLVLLASCHRNQDPFFGRWTVEKVNVEFREDLATPEIVRQIGALEKDNILEIAKDSVLTLITDGDTLRGLCSLRDGQLYVEGTPLGWYEQGRIYTETLTPLGKVKVVYSKDK